MHAGHRHDVAGLPQPEAAVGNQTGEPPAHRVVVGDVIRDRLRDEVRLPGEQEWQVLLGGEACGALGRAGVSDRRQLVDALTIHRDVFAAETCAPCIGERLRFLDTTHDARWADARLADRCHERIDGARRTGLRDRDVVRWGLQRGAHDLVVVLDDPQVEGRVGRRASLQGIEDPQEEVVPGRRPQQEGQHLLRVGDRVLEASGTHPTMLRDPNPGRAGASGWRDRKTAALTCGFPLAHTWRLPRDEPGDEREESQIAIEVGATIQATVARIENYGAFLQLEDGRMGLVHISEIDRNYVKDVREHLREGDTVDAKVVAIKDDGKIDLSIKALQDPAPPRPSRRGSDPEFETMLKKFMRQSEERQVDFRRATEHKRK